MRSLNPAICAALCLGVVLSGCASAEGRYPSLAVRDAERTQGTLRPTPASESSAVAAINPEQLLAPATRAKESHSKFTAQQGEVNDLVLASIGRGPEDDLRARALVGLAGLTSLRGQTALALSDLDRLEVAAATEFKPTKEIRDQQASVQQMIAQQDAALDSLSEMLAK